MTRSGPHLSLVVATLAGSVLRCHLLRLDTAEVVN